MDHIIQELWANTIEVVNDIWSSIQVIHEKKDLVNQQEKQCRRSKKSLVRNLKKLLKSSNFLIPKIGKNLKKLELMIEQKPY